jgi:hypothetical protein
MSKKSTPPPDRRSALLAEIERLAGTAIFGTLSETYRTCGNAGCRCHGAGPKHGPHLYVSFRGDAGKTTGYYVPKSAHTSIRDGVDAWQALSRVLRELAELNKEEALAKAREESAS